MPNPFVEEMEATLPWLFQDMGFRVTSQSYSYKAMGAAMVDLDSEVVPLRLRFLSDRGVDAQVAPLTEPEEFASLGWVLPVVRGEPPEPQTPPMSLEEFKRKWEEGRPRVTLAAQAALFRDNLDVLVEAMGPKWPETKQEIERRHQLRLQAAMTPRPVSPQIRLRLVRLRWRRYARLLAIPAAAAIVWWIVTKT